MSGSIKSSIFNKDKNNKLSVNQCQHFFKDYNNFKKGRVKKIFNPKTNKQLVDKDRIEFIYLYCRKKVGLDDDVSSASSSVSSSRSSGSSISSTSLDNEILLDSYSKVEDIIELPLNDIVKNREIISNLFSKPISLDTGLLKLKEYLEKTDRMQNIYVDAYYRFLEEINKLINEIYYNNTFAADLLTLKYNWKKDYKYNPFEIHEDSSIEESVKKNAKDLKKMWVNIKDLNNDIRVSDFMFITYNEYKNIITYSENNKNHNEMMTNLDNNKFKYYAIQFILVQIRDANSKNPYVYDNTNDTIKLIDRLLSKNIFQTTNISKSVSKSISWTGTPRSSSSGHSHFQSKANIVNYRKKKEELVAIINDNNINDSDPYMVEEWSDMPLRKLKNVLSIKYTDSKGKTFSYAFYVRTLYQAWRKAVKYSEPFVNPYTRKLFTANDKDDILNAMMILYPGIKRPVLGFGRNDIVYKKYIGAPNIMFILFKYVVRIPNNQPLLVEVINMEIPLSYEIEFPPEYVPQILFDNIEILITNNKIFGKDLPLKPLNIFNEFNKMRILNFQTYKYIFDSIRNAI
jgi:hypothetical protein